MIFDLKQDLQQQTLLYLSHAAGSQPLSVEQNDVFRWLKINSTIHSVMQVSQPDKLILPHLHPMMLAQYFAPDAKTVLELGLGGGAIQRYMIQHTDLQITSVEIDPVIIDCFQQYFNPGQLSGNIVQADAQAYLSQTAEIDLLLVDLFDHQHCPDFLFEKSFYQQCRAAMTDKAVLVLNLLPAYEFQVAHVLALLERQFGHLPLCFSVPGYSNRVFLIALTPLSPISFDAAFFTFVDSKQIDLNAFVLDR